MQIKKFDDEVWVDFDRAEIKERAIGDSSLVRVEIQDGDRVAVAWLGVKFVNGRPRFQLTTKTKTSETIKTAFASFNHDPKN